MAKTRMSFQVFAKEDWLSRMERKSDSKRTRRVAQVSLSMFELFCKEQGRTEDEMIVEFQKLFKEGDIRSICLSLDRFVQFLNEDHEEIILNPEHPTSFKRKNPKTIKTYFSFVKSYLRICHGVKISTEDIKDYVTFPKQRKEPRKAISIKTLKKVFSNASPVRRALYCVLVSSGMRIGEALTLTPQDFHFKESPVRVTIQAEITKTKEGRETYISSEAVEKLRLVLDGKNGDERIFTHIEDIDKAVTYEDRYFRNLLEKLGFTEKYKYSNRYVVNIHAFRAYFHTKASQKHGSDYANALDGHGAYLKQYYRETPEERAKKYKELEPSLLIESYKMESEKIKDKIIANLQEEMQKLQDKMTRLELLNS